MQCLLEQGVDTVFGYPGGAILNVYDALYKYSDKIRHILTSHEQGAAHAADGYARASGKVGVCMATSGPGATNLVTGIATAFMDSVPMVAITCNVTLPLLGKDSFQEVDIAGITMPITKHGFIVKDVTSLAETVRSAFRIARSGRPGPVLIDITKDVTAAVTDFEPQQPALYLENPTPKYTEEDISQAARMIREAKKPFVYVGGGGVISGAYKKIRELVSKIDAPVCDTLMGKGVIDGHDPHYTGMIGMHGTKASNLGVSACDLLIVLGSRFSDRQIGSPRTFAKNAKILQIDIDDAEVNKNIHVDRALVGDLKEILEKLLPEISPSIITTDVGQHQMWAAQYYTYSRPRTFITSGGLGTMGYGLGAAIGAKTAEPDKTVINIAGDGCFRMNMNELATASRYGIKVIEVVINNQVLGMVRQWQTLYYGKRYSATVLNDKVDYCKVAEALGCRALRVKNPEDLEPALIKALQADGPVLVDCVIEEDDKVFPMVSPGTSIEDVFDEKDFHNQD